MTIEKGKEILYRMFRELKLMIHGEIHIVLKVRDG